jgi:kumamolisin
MAELEARVRDIYALPLKRRRYLSREELASEYGGRAEDFDAVEHFAQQHNLVVSQRSTAQRRIVLTGELGDQLRAFPADLCIYHHPSGEYRGRQGEIYIPRQFKGLITGIFGFDTRQRHKFPRHHHKAATSGPGGRHGVAATDFARRYNFPTRYKGRKLDGAGQCIGIIELGGGFNSDDLRIYFKEIGVPLPKITAVSVDRAGNHPTKYGQFDSEVMIDVEVAGSVAPKARIALYFAPNRGNGLIDAVTAAVHDADRNPGVVSISWGSDEDTIDDASFRAFHEIFVEAAALGITICTASGDHGSAGDSDRTDWGRRHHIDHPSVDHYVVACGGTQIDADGNETVWNDERPFGPKRSDGGWASGGGISDKVSLAYYQKSAKVPKSIFTGKRGRGVPDIAMSADNYFLRWQGVERAYGGTSCASPLFAGLVALLNQAKGKNVGFLNPFLYANAGNGVVTDITEGTNAIFKTLKGYEAGPGWDACTGLGAPNGTEILNKL